MCACSAQDQIDMEHMVHIDVEELHTLIEGEEIMEAASLLMVLSSLLCFFLCLIAFMYICMQEAHGLDTEVILTCAMHMLGGAEGLQLFSNGLNMKAVAFSINDGLKELIQWRFSDWIDRLIAFKPS